MVAERNRTIRVRPRMIRGKENIRSSYKLRHKEEAYLRKLEFGISIFRDRILTRVDRCQEVLENLDRDSKQMKICFLQLMDMVENSKKLISNEKEENLQLLQLFDDCYSDKLHVSSKTQTVTPMIYGIPLKKASISLKRLEPFHEQHLHIPTVIADSAPASDVGFSRTAAAALHRSVEPLDVNLHSSSEDEDSASDIALARYNRCRRWRGVPNHVPPSSREEFRLKRASIQLKRLDPSYLLEAGNAECLNSRNMPFQRSDAESDVLESLYRVSTSTTSAGDENARSQSVCITPGRNCVPCLPLQPDPMVVLKRLGPFTISNELDSHDQNTSSASSGVNGIHETCQAHNKLRNASESSGRCKIKNDNAKKSQQQAANSTCSARKRKQNNSAYDMLEKQKGNYRVNSGKRSMREGESTLDLKRKKTETIRKKKDVPLNSSTTDRLDEDPLEGPSWLYKDGVKKERLRKMRRIRQGYLTPIYYLAPTIYSSTDDSGDEMTENERKSTKLRKKKKKRN